MCDRGTEDLHRRRLTRRTLVRGGVAVSAGLPLAGPLGVYGGEDEDDEPAATVTMATAPAATSTIGVAGEPPTAPPGSPTPADGEWSFTDDRGVTITLPKRPERIVAYTGVAAALWDLGVEVVGVYGTTRLGDGSPGHTVGEIDLGAVESLGEVYGELDLERLVALQPDLIVFDWYGGEADYWGLGEGENAQLEAIAPTVGIMFLSRPVTDIIGSSEALATALGADVETPEIAAARAEFEQASADLEAAIAAKPGLTVLVISGYPDQLLIWHPEPLSDLSYFKQLGMEIVVPDGTPEEGTEALSWEQAGKYPADLILQEAPIYGALTIEELSEIPTFAAQPAARAGQVALWQIEFVKSYRGVTEILRDLTETVRESRADVV